MRVVEDARNGRFRDGNRKAELGFTETGCDVWVGLCVDVGVDAQADGNRTSDLLRHAFDNIELLGIFDVQRANPRLRCCRDLLAPLANAAVHDALGREPSLEGALHLTERHDVRSTTLRGEPREHRQIAVGLDRVGDQVRGEGQRLVDRAICIVDRRARVHERGRFDLRCDRRERNILAYERTVSVREPRRFWDVHVGHGGPL